MLIKQNGWGISGATILEGAAGFAPSGSLTLYVSKAGGGFSAAAGSATYTTLGFFTGVLVTVTFASADLDTVGQLAWYVSDGGTSAVYLGQTEHQVVAWDPQAGDVASVVGSVNSVVNDVGGNVVGSVNSVVNDVGGNVVGLVGGSVGSVLGNVGGDVLGSVQGSVVGSVSDVANPASIVTAVWGEDLSIYGTPDTAGYLLFNAGGGSSPATIAAAVWTDLLAGGDFGVAGSIGKLLADNINATISSRSTYAGGPVASVTGNVGGNVVGSVGSVLGNVGGNVAGDVAGDLLGSVLGSVGSVAGDLGGNVLGNVAGSVGSVVAGVTLDAAGLDAVVVHTGANARQALAGIAASCYGVTTRPDTETITFADPGDADIVYVTGTWNFVTQNRQAVVLSLPA